MGCISIEIKKLSRLPNTKQGIVGVLDATDVELKKHNHITSLKWFPFVAIHNILFCIHAVDVCNVHKAKALAVQYPQNDWCSATQIKPRNQQQMIVCKRSNRL